jgi:glycosyltransferase involved in cell wall biosynthesis
MIIVDDESTDNTESVVRRYDDPRITYIRQNHVGPYRMNETYNRALDRARGEYIAVLEGDDLWPKNKLERQLSFIADHPEAVACYGRAGMIDNRGESVGLYSAPECDSDAATTRDFVLRRSAVQPVTVIIRHNVLSAIGGFIQDTRLPVVDLPTWLRLSLEGPFQFQDSVLGVWRIHGHQVSANYEMNSGALEIAIDFFRALPPDKQTEIGVTEPEIRRAHQRFLADESWSGALAEMNNGRWRDARRAVCSTLVTGSGFRRLEATLALGCTFVHLNPTQAIVLLASTTPGRRIVERHNPLARHRNPGFVTGAPSSNRQEDRQACTRSTSRSKQ